MNENELLDKAERYICSGSIDSANAFTFLALTRMIMRVVDYYAPKHVVCPELNEDKDGQSEV